MEPPPATEGVEAAGASVQGPSALLPERQRPVVKARAPMAVAAGFGPEGMLVGSPFVGRIRYQLYCWFCGRNQKPWEG